MNFTESIRTCFRKYAIAKGRASKSEFWWFQLLAILVRLVYAVSPVDSGIELLASLATLALIVPVWTASVRRMHDVGKSGWYTLLPIVNIYFLLKDSQPHANQYGLEPSQSSLSISLPQQQYVAPFVPVQATSTLVTPITEPRPVVQNQAKHRLFANTCDCEACA